MRGSLRRRTTYEYSLSFPSSTSSTRQHSPDHNITLSSRDNLGPPSGDATVLLWRPGSFPVVPGGPKSPHSWSEHTRDKLSVTPASGRKGALASLEPGSLVSIPCFLSRRECFLHRRSPALVFSLTPSLSRSPKDGDSNPLATKSYVSVSKRRVPSILGCRGHNVSFWKGWKGQCPPPTKMPQ